MNILLRREYNKTLGQNKGEKTNQSPTKVTLHATVKHLNRNHFK